MLKLFFILLLLIIILSFIKGQSIYRENFDPNPFKVIEHLKTNFQDIKVLELRNKDTCLMIDDEIQFCNNMIYQDILVELPKTLIPNMSKVLLIGTGDNLILKSLLNKPNIQRIDVIDIDKDIFKISQKYFYKDLQNNSKVNFIIGDVSTMINDAPKNYYDLIVIDIFNQPKRKNSLNSEIFLEKCKKRLKQRDSVLIKRGGFTDTDAETLENARSNKKNALIKNRDLQDVLSSVFKYTQTFHIDTYKPVTYNICSNNIDVKEYTYTDDRLV